MLYVVRCSILFYDHLLKISLWPISLSSWNSRITSYARFHVYCLSPPLDASPMRTGAYLAYGSSPSRRACLDCNWSSESIFWTNEWWNILTDIVVKHSRRWESRFRYSKSCLARDVLHLCSTYNSRMHSAESMTERFDLEWIPHLSSQPTLPWSLL